MSKKSNPPDNHTAGLVHLEDDKIGAVPLFFCHGKWYGPNREGGFTRYRDTHAGSLVAEYGFNRKVQNTNGSTPSDRALLWLAQNRAVAHAGPVAGWPTGCHVMAGKSVLVTEALRLLTPKKGPWPDIQNLIEPMFEDKDHDQVTVIYVWISACIRHLYERMKRPGELPFQHCPALAIFGDASSGKSALIDLVLRPVFGGVTEDPLSFLREGKFNKELFNAGLLVLDDKGASSNLDARREMGDAMKALIWTEFQRLEGKGADALSLAAFRRLVIAGNFEDSSLNIAPALNASLRDKLILTRARKGAEIPEDVGKKAAWIARLTEQLPAFVHFLLTWKYPKRVQLDARSGVVNFWHPEIAGALLEKQPECKAIEVINLLFKNGWPLEPEKPTEPPVKGTATDFYGAVRERDPQGHYEKLFRNIYACGTILSELARTMPDRVEKRMLAGTSRYIITAVKP